MLRRTGETVSIDAMTYDNGIAMTVTSGEAMEGVTAYAAIYENGALVTVKSTECDLALGTTEVTITEDTVSFDPDKQTLKGFLWGGGSGMEPLCGAYTYPETTDSDETETTGYVGTFVTDEHATINVYHTQDYTEADETNVTTTYARNSDDGEVTTDSTLKPQINFLVVVEDGYEVASVEVTPTENYNAIKGYSDTGVENLYRITKINGDITITVTTTESSSLPELDEGVISAFRYSTETEISGANTEGDVSAAITASVDGENTTALGVSSGYTDTDETVTLTSRTSAVLAASDDAAWGESPYVQVALSTENYTDIMVSAKVGASKKGPASYKLQYSTDGTTFANVGESYALTDNKTLYQAFSKVDLGDSAENCSTLYIRIVPADTTNLNGDTFATTTDGEFAVNDILIYGTSTGDGIIHLEQGNITAINIANVTVDNENSTVTISAGGDYEIDGSLTDGQIIVTATDSAVNITLDSVSVTSSTADEQPFCASDAKVKINLIPNGTCSFASTGDSTAAILTKKDLSIKCDNDTDTFNVTSTGKGIHCKGDLEIGNGVFVVNSGADGIQGNDSVKITAKNDSVTVTSTGDGIRSNSDPSLSTEDYESGGTVTINGGVITVNASSDEDGTTNDGIQADTLLEIKGGTLNITATGEALKANASSIAYLEDGTTETGTHADGDGCILISDGTITASAGEDGIKAVKNVTISGGSVTLTQATDGIQVNEIIYTDATEETVSAYVAGEIDITGGTLNITSTEDGIQCKTGDINISDGTITVNATLDGIQSSSDLYVSGGTLNITTNGGASGSETDESCKGLKASGNIYITDGDITVDSYDDSIHSNSSVYIGDSEGSTEPEITVTSSDDGVHADVYLYIYNGTINVENSYEGLEGAEIYISGGTMIIKATDDGINGAGDEPDSDETASTSSIKLMAPGDDNNAGTDPGGDDSSDYGYIQIDGGYIYMTITSTGDGLDSNGSLLINGGIVIVDGCKASDADGIDFGDGDDDEIDITGGYVITIAAEGMATINTLSRSAAKL
ncbi:MAG: carbohydrate-binding domain-containing protein, partial [Firmicutes bacterium]|nr:carbohydrate-binding domain-containing protein [Bacillota bacterium]